MHKSKLGGFIIDCQTSDLKSAAGFWGSALGMSLGQVASDESENYLRLADPLGRLDIEVQAVTHPSRVHLDIETDDIEAEVRRLEALGARRVAQVKTWWVLQAPTGQRFCVVTNQSPKFAEEATQWP
jgi:predicted enzyme related to lactoylglutathione lyase